MPKELKKRGRRVERQIRDAAADGSHQAKRRKFNGHDQHGFDVTGDAGDDFIGFGSTANPNEYEDEATTFYGLLTEEEQRYYANVNSKISSDDFEDDLDKVNFVEAVHRETVGKEIKVASSQSCSRYLEKVIHLSTPNQLQLLFLAFLEDIEYLVQHRFGSHCVEALFTEGAKYVGRKSQTTDERSTSFESLFLDATAKLQTNSGYLITEKFASHTIRILLLVLSGLPLEDSAAKDVVASRKKENVDGSHTHEALLVEARKVPDSFRKAWQDFVRSAVSGLETTYLQALATSPTGSPVLQLFLRIELLNKNREAEGRNQILLQKLIPDQQYEPESDAGKFVSGLIYDASGAYLVQTLVRYLPGKSFKKLYKNLFKARIGKLAKNEIASYVAISIFERIGRDDLTEAVQAIVPELAGLIERNRLAVVRSLIERSTIRNADLQPMRKALHDIYGVQPEGFLRKMLQLDVLRNESELDSTKRSPEHSSMITQGSLLAQSILRSHDLSKLVQDGLVQQNNTVLLLMAQNPFLSRVIQVALSSDTTSTSFLRQFVPKLFGSISVLAINPSGSHVVDALWPATTALHFMKERIASNLQDNEKKLRESLYGRRVWKNWSMDQYQRRPGEWQAIAKEFNQKAEEHANKESKKSGIELARERYMQKQVRKDVKTNELPASLTA